MDNKLSNIKERILYLIEKKGDVKDSFFEKIGMTYGSFKGTAKKRPLNSDAIVNLLTIFPDVNLDWLLTGEGEMLRPGTGTSPVPGASQAAVKDISTSDAIPCPLCAEKDKVITNQAERIQELKETIAILRAATAEPSSKRRSA